MGVPSVKEELEKLEFQTPNCVVCLKRANRWCGVVVAKVNTRERDSLRTEVGRVYVQTGFCGQACQDKHGENYQPWKRQYGITVR